MRATVQDIAEIVGLHPNTIRNWTDEGIIKCVKDFRGWRRFPNPLKTVREIQRLLNGEQMPKRNDKGSEKSER
ncbi:MAG: helix-turn-helix domain-containing protein [Candidatus Poribacteria bacterium]